MKPTDYMKKRKPTLAMARRMIKKANPGVKITKLSWEQKPGYFECIGARGTYYWGSFVNVEAEGYKPKRMSLSVGEDYKSIR